MSLAFTARLARAWFEDRLAYCHGPPDVRNVGHDAAVIVADQAVAFDPAIGGRCIGGLRLYGAHDSVGRAAFLNLLLCR